MDLFAPRHLLIILVVCLVVFGTKKLKTLGADLGGAVTGFKQAMREGESEEPATATSAAIQREAPAHGSGPTQHAAAPELTAPAPSGAAASSPAGAKMA